MWGFVWLIRDYRALATRPMRVGPDALMLRVGSRWEARIPLEAIVSCAPPGENVPKRGAKDYLRATVVGDPTLLLTLREPVAVRGPYGITKRARVIGISPDERARFEEALAEAMRRRPAAVAG